MGCIGCHDTRDGGSRQQNINDRIDPPITYELTEEKFNQLDDIIQFKNNFLNNQRVYRTKDEIVIAYNVFNKFFDMNITNMGQQLIINRVTNLLLFIADETQKDKFSIATNDTRNVPSDAKGTEDNNVEDENAGMVELSEKINKKSNRKSNKK